MKRLIIALALLTLPCLSFAVDIDCDADSDNQMDLSCGGTNAETAANARTNFGLGTSDNPTFNSLNAAGGNIAASNTQVTKKWITGLQYTANVTSVIHGGRHYICTSTHTASAAGTGTGTNEPGVGDDWATVWTIGVLGDTTIYTQDTEPTGGVDGDIWVDTNGTSGARLYTYEDSAWVAQAGGSGLTSLPTADNQIIQATGVGTYGWTSSLAGVIDDTATNGDVDKLWSADKIYDLLAGKQASDSDLTALAALTTTATGLSILDDTTTGAMLTTLGLTANGQSLVTAANYAAMRTLLDLESGTDFNAYDADLTSWAAITPSGVLDFGGSTSLEVPNGASPTVDAAGEVAVDTTSDQLIYYGAAKRVLTYKKQIDFAVKTPVDADDFILFKAQIAMTITDIHVIAQGGTSISVDIQECTSAGASCATVDAAITADTDGAEDDGTLTNGAIDAGDWVKVVLGAPSGTVNYLAGSIYYVETAD